MNIKIGPGHPVRIAQCLLEEMPVTLKDIKKHPFIKEIRDLGGPNLFLLSFSNNEYAAGEIWIARYEFEYLKTKPFDKNDWL